MHIRRYFLAASMLIFVTGWAIYIFITKESTSFEVMGIMLPSLPIAVWVGAAMSILLIATLLHMIFHTLTSSLRLRKFETDYKRLKTSIVDAYLLKNGRSHKFKTERYKLLGKIVDNTKMVPDNSLAILEDKNIASIVEVINSIDSGNSVELKSYNLATDNELVVKNNLNKFKAGELEPEQILAKKELYTKELREEAYLSLAKVAPVHVIENYRESVSFEALLEIIKRVDAKKYPLSIANETIADLVEHLGELNSLEYLKIAQVAIDIKPEQRLAIFERLSSDNSKAIDAYLYTLFDLEMVEKATEILDSSSENEYILFKAFADLKISGKHYDIKTLIALLLH